MKASTCKVMLLIVLALSLIVGVQALDDDGNPNDPNDNSRANACYEGGSMAGKCDTPEEWEAGWYLIRFEYGLISREDFPSYFSWALPDEVVDTPSNCFTNGTYSLQYSGASAVSGNFTMFNSTNCTGGTLPRSTLSSDNPIIIVANSPSTAGVTCSSIQTGPGTPGIDSLGGSYGYASPSNYYVCISY